MLELMRRHAYSWTTRVVLGFLAVIFMFWGVGTGLFSQVHPVATVNGKRILAAEVDREAQNLRQQLQQMYGANAAQLLRNMNLRQEALDRIIENRLSAEEARHIGIRISDDALQQEVAGQRAFQVDGQFSFEQYQGVLRSNNLLPNEYEASMRTAMTEDALRHMIDQAVQVSDAEARHAYDLLNEKISLAYIEIPYQDFMARVSPAAQQVEDFYKKNLETFREPERIKIAYIHYDPHLLAAKINPSDKQIGDYYQRNLKTRFTHPDQVHARHILIEVPSGATPEQKTAAKARAEDLLSKLQKGADFAKLAAQYSEDPGTRLQGGDLGAFGRGQMIKPFEDTAFSMKPGELRTVETRFGFHVLKLDAFTPAHTDTLQEAKPKIIEMLRSQAGERLAREALDQDVSSALSGQSLQEIAKKRGIEAVQTPDFSRQEASKAVQDPRLLEAAFKLEPGQVRAVPGGTSPYLVKLISRTPSTIPPLKDVEPKLRDAYIRSVAESDARVKAQQLLGQFKTPEDFDRVANESKLQVHKTDSFSRSSNSVPVLGPFPEVTDAAAALARVPGVIARVMENRGNSYIFQVTARTAPPDQEWKSKATAFTDEYLQQHRAQAWTSFLDSLKARAKITIDASQLGQEAPEPSF